eukprot:GHVS01070927.1.p1 GENE.GHVS01070927.1~~GHVS01070927.1.p1  ORF type:complete len:108 (+),score=16.60 GHVS01070927.1:227-550(+)
MVFYEYTLIVSKHLSSSDVLQLFQDSSRVVFRHSGSVLKVEDFGWRELAFRVCKPRVGTYWHGRLFSFTFGANPTAVRELRALYDKHNGVLRHLPFKLKYKNSLLLG